MTKRRFFCAVCAGVLLALAGCVTGGEAGVSQRGESAVTATQAESGKTLALAVGQTLTVRLPGNYTTGYSWHFLAPREGLVIVSEDYEPGNVRLAGAPGVAVVTVKAVKAGRYPLVGYYYRPWEELKPQTDTSFSVTVAVKER